MFKPKLAIWEGYFRWTSTITRVTEFESQHFRSERNLSALLVQPPILQAWTGEVAHSRQQCLYQRAGRRTRSLNFNPVIYTLAIQSVV